MRLSVLLAFALANGANAQELYVSRYHIEIQQDRQDFLDKTVEEIQTPEGQAILSSIAAYAGVPLEAVTAATAAIATMNVTENSPEDFSGLIQSAPGYTICFAKTTCTGTGCGTAGAGQHGIETHGDSTFNGTVQRVIPGAWDYDGLAWYLNAPEKASGDSRVDAWFDVGFVKAEGDWMERFNCQPNGFHPWLARNNTTTLDVPCNPEEGAWCGDQ